MSVGAYEVDFDLCEATGKRIYITAAKAYVYANRIQCKNRRNGDRHAVHAFRCSHCEHWHIGHMVKARAPKGGNSPRHRRQPDDKEDLAA